MFSYSKLLVLGLTDTGKTAMMQAISQTQVQNVESPAQLADVHQQPEAGKFDRPLKASHVIDTLFFTLEIFGIPAEAHYQFLWQASIKNALGTVIVLDSAAPDSLEDIKPALATWREHAPGKYVLAANKQDLPEALTPEAIRSKLALQDNELVVPCVAIDKASARKVWLALFKALPQDDTIRRVFQEFDNLQ